MSIWVLQKVKEGCDEVKDDSRNGRPSTSRTKVNVLWVWQVVCGDFRLIFPMITSQLNMKKDSVWKIITEDLDMSEK